MSEPTEDQVMGWEIHNDHADHIVDESGRDAALAYGDEPQPPDEETLTVADDAAGAVYSSEPPF